METKTHNNQTLYEQLGGESAVAAVVEDFYKLVLSDPILEEFFIEVSIEFLKKHQRNFVTMALGGPKNYTGKDMRKAHLHMTLEDVHFDHVCAHLATSLKKNGANDEQLDLVMKFLEPLRNEVLNR